jgi:uncharacterized repeat protein (TIGR02543 family)
MDYKFSINMNNWRNTYVTEDNTFYLPDSDDSKLNSNHPHLDGYTFTGWSKENSSDPVNPYAIEQGSTGDQHFIANWKANDNTKYTVRHFLEVINYDTDDWGKTNLRTLGFAYKLYDNQGEHFIAVGAGFCPIIDGIRVVGNSNCLFYFDGTGLVELIIELYNYEKIDTMKLIPLQEAIERITDPDDFSVDNDGESNMIGIIDTLQVNRIELRYVNQFSQGKKFLIPVYCFFGVAIDKEGVQSKFTSIVNAFSS